MAIRFQNDRLHVGLRATAWTSVWFETDVKNLTPEGESKVMLYFSSPKVKDEYRGPMEGEIMWNQHFDPKRFIADSNAEKKRLWNRYLTDAYKYLVEKDPEKVRNLEDELDEIDDNHWQSWFMKAKDIKKTQMKRLATLQARGLSKAEAEKAMNAEDDDEAYESDEFRERQSRAASQMPPPSRPASKSQSNKRRSSNSIGNPKGPGKKRGRDVPASRGSSVKMSGANGSRTSSVTPSTVSGLEDYEDEVMDTSDPTDQQPPASGIRSEWDFAALNTPPATRQRPGDAASQSGRRRQPSRSANDENEQDDPAGRDERARRHEAEQNELYGTEEDAFQAAIRASEEPSVRGEDDVIDSTEADIDES